MIPSAAECLLWNSPCYLWLVNRSRHPAPRHHCCQRNFIEPECYKNLLPRDARHIDALHAESPTRTVASYRNWILESRKSLFKKDSSFITSLVALLLVSLKGFGKSDSIYSMYPGISDCSWIPLVNEFKILGFQSSRLDNSGTLVGLIQGWVSVFFRIEEFLKVLRIFEQALGEKTKHDDIIEIA